MTLEDPTTLAQRLEAILMTADRPMSDARLLDILELAPADEEDDGPSPRARLHEAIEALNADYAASARSFRVNKVAGGWQMLTLPAFTGDITRLKGARQLAKLSSAALETLAIIAYKQPILRTDIESIRGVACGEMLRSLMDRRLIKIAGRAEEVGRPMLYGTSREFLEVFGLASLGDLPKTE